MDHPPNWGHDKKRDAKRGVYHSPGCEADRPPDREHGENREAVDRVHDSAGYHQSFEKINQRLHGVTRDRISCFSQTAIDHSSSPWQPVQLRVAEMSAYCPFSILIQVLRQTGLASPVPTRRVIHARCLAGSDPARQNNLPCDRVSSHRLCRGLRYLWSLKTLSSGKARRLMGVLAFKLPCGRCQL